MFSSVTAYFGHPLPPFCLTLFLSPLNLGPQDSEHLMSFIEQSQTGSLKSKI
uniref:Uncharacterized protein n=1 Tax=Lepeophtheirus salmonis TaxID=72036 RepID=A0A0K2UM92_LEPSM